MIPPRGTPALLFRARRRSRRRSVPGPSATMVGPGAAGSGAPVTMRRSLGEPRHTCRTRTTLDSRPSGRPNGHRCDSYRYPARTPTSGSPRWSETSPCGGQHESRTAHDGPRRRVVGPDGGEPGGPRVGMVERVDRDRGRSRRHRGWRRGRRATDQLGAAGPRHGRRRRVPHAVPDDARRPDRWSGPPRRDRHPAQHHLRHPGAPPRRGLRAGGGPGLRTRPTRCRHHRWDRPDRSRHRPQRHPLLRRPGTGRRRAAAAVPALDQGRRHRPHPRARAGRGPHARPLTPRDPGGPDPAERRQPVRLRPGPRPAPGGHGPRRRARVGRSVELAVALVLAGGAVLAAGSPAYAHATLVATSPANGAELDAPPAEIRLRFSERVTVAPDGVTLRDADGVVVETPPAGTTPEDPTTVVLPVPGDLPQGAYVVVYRVVSEDSHPVA